MEHNESLTKIQGLLSSFEKSVGPLNAILHRGGNETKILPIIARLHKYCVQNQYINKEGKELQPEMLQKITYFLVLNCDLSDKENLKNDPLIGHLVSICPVLSPCVLLDCVWGLNLDRFLCEVLAYCPVTLSIELLRGVVTSINYSNPYPLLERVRKLIQAIYLKMYRLQTDKIYYIKLEQALSELLKNLVIILNHYITPDSVRMDGWGTNELYRYAGYAMKSVLMLTHDCITIYVDKPSLTSNNMYDITYHQGAEFYYSPENRIRKVDGALQEANKCILRAVQANLSAINVNIYCAWAEFSLENSKTLQQIIANYAYLVNDRIKHCNLCPEFLEEISGMLSSVAIKPNEIGDEIYQANFETIIQHVRNEDKDQMLWFDALVSDENVLKNNDGLRTLNACIHLCSIGHVKTLLAKTIELNQRPPSNLTEIKEVILNCVKSLPISEQIEAITAYFNENGLSNNLELPNYNTLVTETFNKTVSVDMVDEMCTLMLQNPINVFEVILQEALKDKNHTNIMLNILRHFTSICKMPAPTNSSTELLLFSAFKTICEKIDCNQVEVSTFISLLNGVVTEKLLSIPEIAKDIFFKLINKNVELIKPSNVIFWLEVIDVICLFDAFTSLYLPFLIFLSEVTKKSRGDITNFSTDNMVIIQATVKLINKVITKIQAENLLQDNQISYLRRWVKSTPTVNSFYFTRLWDDTNITFLRALWAAPLSGHTQTWNVARLIELLPFCTQQEWRLLAKQMIEERNDVLYVYQLFNDFFGLLSSLVKASPSTAALSCFEYCVRNYTAVLKELICPCTSDSYNAQLIVWEGIQNLMANLPAELEASCSLVFVNILFLLLENLKSKNENVLESTILDMIKSSDNEANRIICKNILDDQQ